MRVRNGFVSLVGAGPGDMGLITTKGLNCIKNADVIVYDRLVNPRLLRNAKLGAELIYCGKCPEKHFMVQDKINQTLVQYAQKKQYVVRLKGGDPSVFGRVGEEAENLFENDIPFEIVPGITSSIAAAAYAGIPVTHRDYSASISLRTGHTQNETDLLNNIQSQAKGETLIYYMSMKNLPKICEKLVESGSEARTKVAVIEWGTLGKQRIAEGTLETIVSEVARLNISNPSITIVGDVVGIRSKLSWFEHLKYFGRKILLAKSNEITIWDLEEEFFTENGAEIYAFPSLKKVENEMTPDFRFDEVNLRMLNACVWDSIIFSNCESVDWFIKEMSRFEQKNFKEIAFAYPQDHVRDYALLQGFKYIDENLCDIIMREMECK